MQDVHACQVLDSLGDLSDDRSRFFLFNCCTLIKKALEVEAVGIFLNHEDVVLRFDRLEMPDAVVAVDQAVDLDLLLYHLEVVV